jgi:hypothetical protein
MKVDKYESGSKKMQRIKKEAQTDFYNRVADLGGRFECEHGCPDKHDPIDSYAVGTIIALMDRDDCLVLEQVILKIEEDDKIPEAAKELRAVYKKHFSTSPIEKDTLHYDED